MEIELDYYCELKKLNNLFFVIVKKQTLFKHLYWFMLINWDLRRQPLDSVDISSRLVSVPCRLILWTGIVTVVPCAY